VERWLPCFSSSHAFREVDLALIVALLGIYFVTYLDMVSADGGIASRMQRWVWVGTQRYMRPGASCLACILHDTTQVVRQDTSRLEIISVRVLEVGTLGRAKDKIRYPLVKLLARLQQGFSLDGQGRARRAWSNQSSPEQGSGFLANPGLAQGDKARLITYLPKFSS
jgi:hypothetical protein